MKPAGCSNTSRHWALVHPCYDDLSSLESHTDVLPDLLESKKKNPNESALHEESSSSLTSTEFSVLNFARSSNRKSSLKPVNSLKKVCRNQNMKIQSVVSPKQNSESGKTLFETERSEQGRMRIPKRVKSFKMFKKALLSPNKGEALPSYLKETNCSCLRKMHPYSGRFVSNGSTMENPVVLTERKKYSGQRRGIILKRKSSLKSFNITSRTDIDRPDQCFVKSGCRSRRNSCRYAYCSLHGHDPLKPVLSKKAQNKIRTLKHNRESQKRDFIEVKDSVNERVRDRIKEKKTADEVEVCFNRGVESIEEERPPTEEHLDGDSSNTEKWIPPRSRNRWWRLKQRILLKRFIKEVQQLRAHILSGNADSLKHMNSDERRTAEEWFIDYALRQIVGKSDRRDVKLLVEAFESLTLHSTSEKAESQKQKTSGEIRELKDKRRGLWQLLYQNAMFQVEEEGESNLMEQGRPLEEESGGAMDSFHLVKVAVDAVLEEEDDGARKKRWGKVRKMMLLRRFIKEVERVRRPRPEPDIESDELAVVGPRHREMEERRREEEWMLDRALQRVVAQLSPVKRKRVSLLVEAFETVKPNQK